MRLVEVRRVIKVSKLAEWAYCPKCEDLVKFTVQDEIIEEVFRGVKDQEIMIKFPFRVEDVVRSVVMK